MNHAEKLALIFEESVEISDPAKLKDYLDSACADDAHLREQVEVLLRAHGSSGSFLSGGVPPRHVENGNATDPEVLDLKPGDTVGPYRLMGLIGEGSTSTVFLAEQEQPVRRWVALKIVKAGMDTRKVILRFGLERQALAVMDHPGIAKLLDAGATPSGRPFFVMELVDGESITCFCNEREMTIAQRLKLFGQVCQAVFHAHQKGIIHRDLKPDNILVSERDGQINLKIVDFGIAKVLRSWGVDSGTRTSLLPFLGTPAYMSPEQVLMSSPELDTRTDIYSLGVLLYELLAGHPPFDPRELLEAGLEEMCHIIRMEEPIAPSERFARLPLPEREEIAAARGTTPAELLRLLKGDLDWITLKALEKSREQRYGSTDSLARDIECHFENRPVSAAAHTLRYRTSKFLQRKRKLVIAVGALAALVVASTVLVGVMAVKARISAREARESEQVAMLAQRASHDAMVAMHVSSGLTATEDRHPDRAVLWFANAARASQLAEHDGEINSRRAMSWMSRVPIPIGAFKLSSSFKILEFSPDSRFLLAVDTDQAWQVWNIALNGAVHAVHTSNEIVAAAWSPMGATLALVLPDGEVQIVNPERGIIEHSFKAMPVPDSIGFTHDGNRLVLGDGALRVYDLRKRTLLPNGTATGQLIAGFTFAPESDRLATVGRDGLTRIYALEDNAFREFSTVFPHHPAIRTETCPSKSNYREDYLETPRLSEPVLAGGGKRFFTRTGPYEITCWNMGTGDRLRIIEDVCCSCRFAANHQAGLLACGIQGGKVGIWKMDTGEQVQLLPSQGACVLDIDFSRDGRSLITAEASGMARIWDVEQGLERQSPLHHCMDVDKVAFSPDGKRVATGQSDGLVRIWNVLEPEPDEHEKRPFTVPTQVVVDPAGEQFILTREPGWQASPGSCIRRLDVFRINSDNRPEAAIDMKGCIASADFSADSRRLAVGIACDQEGGQKYIRILSTEEVIPGRDACPLPGLPAHVKWSPVGNKLAVICETGEVLLLDVANGELHTWLDRDDSKTSHINPLVTFTPDGTVLVSLGPDGWIRVWDAASGELKYPALVSGKDGFWSFALSSDNRHMATATMDGEVRIWDLQTGLPRPSILQHPGWVYRCRFSPDQKRLITASHDGKVRIWNWSEGKLLGSLLVHPNEVYDAVFTPDSRWVLTACRDGNVRIWDPESSQLVAPPIKVGQQAFNIEITRSGHHAIVGTLGNDLYVLSLETFHKPLPFDAEDLCLVGEVVSGCTVENGHLRDLTTTEWLDRYARIQSLHPEAMESGQAYAIRKHAFDKASIFTGDCSDPSADSKDEDTTVAARPYPSAPSRTLPAKEGCTARCDQCRFSKSLKEG